MADTRALRRQLEEAQASVAAARQQAARAAGKDTEALAIDRETRALLSVRERLGRELAQLESLRGGLPLRHAGPNAPRAPASPRAATWTFDHTNQVILGLSISPLTVLMSRNHAPQNEDFPLAFWCVALLLTTTWMAAQLRRRRP